MPVRVVGRPSKFNGKTFFEIACNLKDFGVGRIVRRQVYLRYPEPSFYKIMSVEPEMDPDNKLGQVIVEHTFRGKYLGQRPLTSVYKPDFWLVAKEDEDLVCNGSVEPIQDKILPACRPFPPLLKQMILDEMKAKGQPCDKEPQLKMVYECNSNTRYRIAGEGEVSDVKFIPHVSWNLYEDVMEVPIKSTS